MVGDVEPVASMQTIVLLQRMPRRTRKTSYGRSFPLIASLLLLLLLLLLALCALPSLAFAHTGLGATHGFAHGFAHPLGGIDHLCAMIAVGLWATQLGGKAVWAVPTTFVVVMALGAALGMAGVQIPFVEKGIILSVLLLGVLVAAAVRLPVAAGALVVALFAVFHGHAHGSEMPASASGCAYGAGFVVATVILHAFGSGVGRLMQKLSTTQLTRIAGAGIALYGVVLSFL